MRINRDKEIQTETFLGENIMTVYCENGVQFMNVIESSVRKGLTFKADFGSFTIEYTGGF